METAPCPGCAAPLKFDQDVCPSCRRPCSADDFERARESLAASSGARRRAAKSAAFWLAAAACAYGLYLCRGPLAGLLDGARDELKHEMDAASAPAAGRPLSPAARQLLGTLSGGRVAPPPAPPGPPRIAERPQEPEAPGPGSKRLYGVVYDLSSASPVAGAQIVFQKGGDSRLANTDADGHYSVDLEESWFVDGLTAVVTAGGYREGQIEDVDPPYLERTPEERLSSLEQLSPSDLEALPVRARPRASRVPFDIVLVPSAPAKAAPEAP
jgi:hypothetical protein